MASPLEGIKVIDMTEVQSGPSCTQMLAWFGAEVIKIERPGGGDPTRHELLDMPGLDGLYYLQLNSNKKSMGLNVKTPQGKEILTKLLKDADVFVENLHPGAAAELGFSWEDVQKINPRIVYGSITGFDENSPYANVKCYEPIAQCAGGAASTTGWWEGDHAIPTQSGAALGDSNTGMHLLIGLLAALLQRDKTGKGQWVRQSMQASVLNLCRVKLRDQLILEHTGRLTNYPQYPNGQFGDSVPRSGNIEGGGVFGWCYKCKGWETDSNAFAYIVIQNEPKAFELFCKGINKPEWVTDPKFSTAEARDKVKEEIYAEVEKFTIDKDKNDVVAALSKFGVPCGPVLSMKEIENDASLRENGTIVEVEQIERGSYLTVGMPMKFSDFTPQIKGAPLLGQDTDPILQDLGYTQEEISQMRSSQVIA